MHKPDQGLDDARYQQTILNGSEIWSPDRQQHLHEQVGLPYYSISNKLNKLNKKLIKRNVIRSFLTRSKLESLEPKV